MLKGIFHSIKFGVVLEREFQRFRNTECCKTYKFTMLFAFFVYNIFLIRDFTLIPDMAMVACVLRLGIVTPILLGCLLLVGVALKRNMASLLPGWVAIIVALTFGGSLMMLHAMTRSAHAAEYFIGCLIVLSAFNAIRWGTFLQQAIGSGLMVLMFVVTMGFVTVTLPDVKVDASLSFASSAALLLLGVYRQDRAERANFLAQTENAALLKQEQRLREELGARNAELDRHATTDVLTGLANRRLLDRLTVSLEGHPAGGAVMMIDVDYFKAYNDHYGHGKGDACLILVARTLCEYARKNDVIVRYGGEEFAVIMPGLPVYDLAIVGKRLCEAVEALNLPHAGRPDGVGCVTVSGGGQFWRLNDGVSLTERLKESDRALYESKRGGRNCFTVASGRILSAANA